MSKSVHSAVFHTKGGFNPHFFTKRFLMNKHKIASFLFGLLFCFFSFLPKTFCGLVELREYEFRGKRILILCGVRGSGKSFSRAEYKEESTAIFSSYFDDSAYQKVFMDVAAQSELGKVFVLLGVNKEEVGNRRLWSFEHQLGYAAGFVSRDLEAPLADGDRRIRVRIDLDGEEITGLVVEPEIYPTRRLGDFIFGLSDFRDRERYDFLDFCSAGYTGFGEFSLMDHLLKYKIFYEGLHASMSAWVSRLDMEALSVGLLPRKMTRKRSFYRRCPRGISYVQWLDWIVQKIFLYNINSVIECCGIGEAVRRDLVFDVDYFKSTAKACMQKYLPAIHFFGACVQQIVDRDSQMVVLVINRSHGRIVGKLLSECGARLNKRRSVFASCIKRGCRHISSVEVDEKLELGSTVLFLSPFRLRCFLHETLLGQEDDTEGMSSCYCNWCGQASGDDGSLSMCPCHKVSYCSVECQMRGWKGFHKEVCSVRRAKRAASVRAAASCGGMGRYGSGRGKKRSRGRKKRRGR